MASGRRNDGRRANQLRDVTITPGFLASADGSCLIEMGRTRVICTASITPGVPAWREASGLGWVTAEYGMLPASTGRRRDRRFRPDGRSVEIQRLIGRTLRNVARFDRMGPHTVTLDCDVLEADGGTRTASITGAQVALSIADHVGRARGLWRRTIVDGLIAAVSVGMVQGQAMLDLDYVEDSAAEVDMNVAMTHRGQYVEVQGSAERSPFDPQQLTDMLALAGRGIRKLMTQQRRAIREGKPS